MTAQASPTIRDPAGTKSVLLTTYTPYGKYLHARQYTYPNHFDILLTRFDNLQQPASK